LLENNREDQRRPEETSEYSGIQGDKAAGRGKSTWLTPAEAIEESGIGRTRLFGFLTSGALPSAKVGRTRHIRRQDLDRFLEERMTGTPAAPAK
jgi:excisionase family DNA binding protein